MELEMSSIFLAFKISNTVMNIPFEVNTSFYFKVKEKFNLFSNTIIFIWFLLSVKSQ